MFRKKNRAQQAIIPGNRIRYLAEISEQGSAVNDGVSRQAEAASQLQHLYEALRTRHWTIPICQELFDAFPPNALADNKDRSILVLRQRYQEALKRIVRRSDCFCCEWPARRDAVRSEADTVTKFVAKM